MKPLILQEWPLKWMDAQQSFQFAKDVDEWNLSSYKNGPLQMLNNHIPLCQRCVSHVPIIQTQTQCFIL